MAAVGEPMEGARSTTEADTRVGYAFVHSGVDGCSRLAYSEVLDDELGSTAADFWRRARQFFEDNGLKVERVLTDNGSCYRSHDFAVALELIRHSFTRHGLLSVQRRLDGHALGDQRHMASSALADPLVRTRVRCKRSCVGFKSQLNVGIRPSVTWPERPDAETCGRPGRDERVNLHMLGGAGHTDSQVRAIQEIDHNLQIIACAGSGKTRVVAERVMHILDTRGGDGITPENIVAFTFTEKAAAELKDRITRLYRGRYGNVEGLGAMYVGTIHGFCLELLQSYVPEYLKYDILDEIGQRLFVDRHSTASGLTPLGLRRWIESNVYLRLLGTLREADIDESLIVGTPIADAFESYTRLLEERRYLDYDGILVNAVVEIEINEGLRTFLSDRVRYLTVDEYQDVNPIQERLVRQLHELGANVCVVGDDDQNIYQWRGSDVDHILHFADRYPGVVTEPLETNFRSTSAIVGAARRIVERNARRLPKSMGSGSHQVFERGDLLALTFTDPPTEAAWIAEKIRRLHGAVFTEVDGTERGLAFSDVAVLLRSVRATGHAIVDALRDAAIPYVVTGMTGLFDTPEVYATCGIFERLVEQIDDTELRARWEDADLGLTESQVNSGLDLLAERSHPDTTGNRFDVYNLQRVFLDFLDRVALREETIPDGRGEVVYYNLGKFSQCISDYEEIHFRTEPRSKYESFVKHLRFQAPSYYPEGGQDEGYAVPDAVRVMTVHQAKGLEFPVVFLAVSSTQSVPFKKTTQSGVVVPPQGGCSQR